MKRSIMKRRSVTRLNSPTISIVGGAIAVNVLMLVSGMGPNVLLMTALVAVVGLAIWFFTDVASVVVATDGIASAVADTPTVSADRRVARLRNGLAYRRSSDDSLDQLRTTLVDLVDDQLLAVHDIDRHLDPAAAHEILGPELTRFVDDERAAKQLSRPRSLDRIVTLIEEL